MDLFRFDTITCSFGRAYLYLKHRNPIKRRRILIEEYHGSYRLVGREALFWATAIFLILLVLCAVIMTVATTFKTYAEQ